MKNTGENRREYIKWLAADRAKRLNQSSSQYEKIKPNIRAAIAKVAGVPNKPLADMDAEERRKLNISTRALISDLVKAQAIISAADITGA